jgi:hypothetical protein
MSVLLKLTPIDKERRLQFALWAMEEEALLHNTRSFLWGLLREKMFQRRPENVA